MIRMPRILAATALAVAALGSTAAIAAPSPDSRPDRLAEKGEAKLAEKLAGRVAGEPVSCIFAPRSNQLDVIEHVGIVYDAGGTIYVARPQNPRSLGRSDALIIDRMGSQLCRQDVTRTFDRYSGFQGVVFLDNFVPYTRAGEE